MVLLLTDDLFNLNFNVLHSHSLPQKTRKKSQRKKKHFTDLEEKHFTDLDTNLTSINTFTGESICEFYLFKKSRISIFFTEKLPSHSEQPS